MLPLVLRLDALFRRFSGKNAKIRRCQHDAGFRPTLGRLTGVCLGDANRGGRDQQHNDDGMIIAP
jgi:hypothetical protein